MEGKGEKSRERENLENTFQLDLIEAFFQLGLCPC